MAESPKKVLQGDRCFICSTSVQKKEKSIFLEKVLLIFQQLSVPVCQQPAGCQFVKIECYGPLIKFKKASDHLEELKDELKRIFKDCELPRTKHLLNVESDSGETQALCR